MKNIAIAVMVAVLALTASAKKNPEWSIIL